MPASLFTKPIDEITKDDFEALWAEHYGEGADLEFKSALSTTGEASDRWITHHDGVGVQAATPFSRKL
jgi:hypothetical protein